MGRVVASRLQELLDTVREIRAEQRAMREEQVRQNVIVERHEQRSLRLEQRVEPIEKHVAMWSGVGKALAVLAALGSVVAALMRVFGT